MRSTGRVQGFFCKCVDVNLLAETPIVTITVTAAAMTTTTTNSTNSTTPGHHSGFQFAPWTTWLSSVIYDAVRLFLTVTIGAWLQKWWMRPETGGLVRFWEALRLIWAGVRRGLLWIWAPFHRILFAEQNILT